MTASESTKEYIRRRDGNFCKSCRRLIDGKKLVEHIDHIVPQSKGGGDELSNLQRLCNECNLSKSDSIPFASLQNYLSGQSDNEKKEKN